MGPADTLEGQVGTALAVRRQHWSDLVTGRRARQEPVGRPARGQAPRRRHALHVDVGIDERAVVLPAQQRAARRIGGEADGLLQIGGRARGEPVHGPGGIQGAGPRHVLQIHIRVGVAERIVGGSGSPVLPRHVDPAARVGGNGPNALHAWSGADRVAVGGPAREERSARGDAAGVDVCRAGGKVTRVTPGNEHAPLAIGDNGRSKLCPRGSA